MIVRIEPQRRRGKNLSSQRLCVSAVHFLFISLFSHLHIPLRHIGEPRQHLAHGIHGLVQFLLEPGELNAGPAFGY